MVFEYLSNKNIFKRHKYASPKASIWNIFGPSAPHSDEALCVAKLSIH